MSVGAIFFAVCSVVCVVGALSVVMARNPIRGAVGLLATIVGIAGLFLMLSAQFLAAIQLIVYAGAVVVLFVFVVMLLGPRAGLTSRMDSQSRWSRILAGVLVGALGLGMVTLLIPSAPNATPTTFGPAAAGHGSIEAVGRLIFTEGLPVFELVTALLIVAVVGAIAVARSQSTRTRKQRIENPTLRLFHGPLLPRDAERPLTRAPLGQDRLAQDTLQKEQA
jgi:NADH-quinone oxidoreductase subunit J